MNREDTAIFTAYDGFVPSNVTEPEKKLMLAILNQAMIDITKRGQLYRDARYFFLEKESEYLFSFPVICQQLGICSHKILQHIGLVPTPAGEGLASA